MDAKVGRDDDAWREAMTDSLKLIEVQVQGVTPLLMNRMTEEQLLQIRSGTKKPKTKRREELPREEAARKVYTLPTGEPYFPTENLMAALIAAGQYVRLDGKRQASTTKSSLVPGFLTLQEPYLPLDPGTWEVDVRGGRNPNGGEAVCLVRPRFDKWGFEVTALLDTVVVGEATCRELFEIALSRIGLGDFRPQRKGIFGRSVITKWKVS